MLNGCAEANVGHVPAGHAHVERVSLGRVLVNGILARARRGDGDGVGQHLNHPSGLASPLHSSKLSQPYERPQLP